MKKSAPPMLVRGASVAILCALAAPSSVYALGFRVPDQDAAAIARGNAFVATADNPSAVYYNPAGITQLEGENLSLGGYGVVTQARDRRTAGEVSKRSQFQALPQAFFTAKVPDYPVALGLGVYSPYGLGSEWNSSPIFTAYSTKPLAYKASIEYFTVNPVIAVEVITNLSIAAGPTFNYSQVDLHNATIAPPGLGSVSLASRFRGRDTAFGFNAGIFWKPLEQHAFGITYRSSTDMTYDGHFQMDNVVAAQPASAKVRLPHDVTFGYSFRPTPAWNFEFDADWTDWHRTTDVTLNKASGSIPLPFNWDSSWMFEFGATRYLGDGWSVSGGYIYSQNSVPDSSLSPTVADQDRHVFSLGVGKKYERASWNLAYQLGWASERTVDAAANSLANGDYTFLSHAIALNFGYRF